MERYTLQERCVNKQNCHIWGSENPRVIAEKPLHPQRVTVWCGLWSGEVIGPHFFENEAGATVTVNGLSYREMIDDFLWPRRSCDLTPCDFFLWGHVKGLRQ